MDPTHRNQLATELASRLVRRWGLPRDRQIHHESLIEEVVGAYERTRKAI